MKKFFSFCLLSAMLLGNGSVLNAASKPAAKKEAGVSIVTTAANTSLRLSASGSARFQKAGQPIEKEAWVFINPSRSFQTFIGMGGAITDAAAETFAKLPPQAQDELIKAYYGKQGIDYTLARTNINSCDFSSDTYVYVQDKDSLLHSFSVSHDEKFRIPLIKKAISAAGGKLPLFVSPWSPPAWMKDNNDMLHGGKLLPRYYQTWANYFVKFIRTYQAKGIPVWGMTVQNEPMAVQLWESCIFTADDERDFVKKYLGPAIEKAGMKSKKIIAWDHNRDLFLQRASVIMNDPDAAKYIWGFGFHWYETWIGDMQYDNVARVHEAFPQKNILFTEGCIEAFKLDRLNDWTLGEKYGKSVINDFNNGTCGWTDWNILLDETGGPNHVGNYCFAPIHADTKTGKLMYTNIYYYLGHFSKYIRPGARRIACASNRDHLLTTAFVNKNGSTVVVVMNNSDDKISYKLWLMGKAAPIESLPHSISTLIIQ
jgi:glucosylceramidase